MPSFQNTKRHKTRRNKNCKEKTNHPRKGETKNRRRGAESAHIMSLVHALLPKHEETQDKEK